MSLKLTYSCLALYGYFPIFVQPDDTDLWLSMMAPDLVVYNPQLDFRDVYMCEEEVLFQMSSQIR